MSLSFNKLQNVAKIMAIALTIILTSNTSTVAQSEDTIFDQAGDVVSDILFGSWESKTESAQASGCRICQVLNGQLQEPKSFFENLKTISEECLTCPIVKSIVLKGKEASVYVFQQMQAFGLVLMGIIALYKYHAFFTERTLAVASGNETPDHTKKIFYLTLWLVTVSVFLTANVLTGSIAFEFILSTVNLLLVAPFLAISVLLIANPQSDFAFFDSPAVADYCSTSLDYSRIESHFGCMQSVIEEAAFVPITVAWSELINFNSPLDLTARLLAIILLFFGLRIVGKMLSVLVVGAVGIIVSMMTMPIWLALLPFENMRGPFATAAKYATRYGMLNVGIAIIALIMVAFLDAITLSTFGVPASDIKKSGFIELVEYDLLDLDTNNPFFIYLMIFVLVANEIVSVVTQRTEEFADALFSRIN